MIIGPGGDVIKRISNARRGIVFISVSWSIPERKARQVFEDAAAQLQLLHPELRIACFRVETDEDKVSQDWLAAVGYPEFAIMGAGSLLWPERGSVVASAPTANSLGLGGVISQTLRLWKVTV